jgi:hypothetical protein
MNTRFQTKGRSTPGHGDQTPSIVRGVIETDAVSESRWVKAVLTRRHATALSTKPESSARKNGRWPSGRAQRGIDPLEPQGVVDLLQIIEMGRPRSRGFAKI